MSDGNSRRNWYRDYFVLEDDVTAVSSQMGAVNIGGVPSDEVDRRIAAALDAQKKEFRIAELESKVKEYEEELEERESPLQSAIGRVAPYLPAILERFFGKPGMALPELRSLSGFLHRNRIPTTTPGYCGSPNGWKLSNPII